MSDILRANLLSPIALAFALGIVTKLIRSEFSLPKDIYSALSIYLLFALGLKGGVELAHSGLATIALPAAVTLLLGCLTPITAYLVLRRLGKFTTSDSAAVAAHYGSVSAVTFIAAQQFVQAQGLTAEGYMPTLLTLLESPGIHIALAIGAIQRVRNPAAAGIAVPSAATAEFPPPAAPVRAPSTALATPVLAAPALATSALATSALGAGGLGGAPFLGGLPAARNAIGAGGAAGGDRRVPASTPSGTPNGGPDGAPGPAPSVAIGAGAHSLRHTLHEVLTARTMVLLVGGLLVGYLMGEKGWEQVRPFFDAPFKGVLTLFILEMGIVAGARLGDLRRVGPFLLGFAVLMPIVHGALGAWLGSLAGLSVAGCTILATMAASASYIAAPPAVRVQLPEANPTYYLTASLAMTFPFNILFGIPIYYQLAQLFAGH